ncbi:hypothetical protein SCHPADRAFT_994383 [Schizopora paradoxa]|uniref:DUF4139 domain-containing protein n=1 Tax=Schizopora paradoxa TaxID=27342 RepID=A0A0H2S061_9AGAM|nr:hypothetical protein SCHPADRAFT_994383 [Schizopora paradoxa]
MSQILLDASKHSIKSVTIFSSSKAEVIRNFSVDLEKGHNEVQISCLPSSIDTESARVTGLGDAVLFDVVCKISDEKKHSKHKYAGAGTSLTRKKALLESEKKIKGHEADMFAQFGYTLNAENQTASDVESFLDKFVGRSRNILRDIAKLDEEMSEVDDEHAELERKIMQDRKRAPTHGQVTAVIMAKNAGTIQMTLTYMVSGASWTPTYDLRATTEGGKPPKTVTLHYRAAIVQNTGEDWTSANLSLSTASPGIFTQLPTLRSLRIVPLHNIGFKSNNIFPQQFSQQTQPVASGLFGQPAQQQQQQQASGFGAFGQRPGGTSTGGLFGGASNSTNSTSLFGSTSGVTLPGITSLFGSTSTAPTGGFGSSPAPQPAATQGAQPGESNQGEDNWTTVDAISGGDAQETDGNEPTVGSWSSPTTSVTESAVASSFRIDDLCSIPSDNSSHKVTVAVLPFEANVHYVAVPRATPVAFLQCAVTNTSEYRLLRGPVNIYMDESPVSKTSISDVNPEETFRCTLGPDPSLRIKLIRLPRTLTTVGSAFAAQTTSASYKFRLLIQNTHTFPVRDIILRDSIPLPSAENTSNSQIKVVLKEPVGLSEATPGTLVDVKKADAGSGSSAKVRWENLTGDKEGKFEWVLNIGAGEEVKVESEYEVRAPSDFKWTLQESLF